MLAAALLTPALLLLTVITQCHHTLSCLQIGFFLGSAVIPIKTPRRPRVTLPVMACCMFLFAPCFAAALMAHARPYVFLALALTMHTYSG
jgi:hypothetical protein